MTFSHRYTAWFDAGHRYRVDVVWASTGVGDHDLDDFPRVAKLITGLAYELDGRELSKQLGPYHPSVVGVAAFFMERLAINVPVTRVEVHESGTDIVVIHEVDD